MGAMAQGDPAKGDGASDLGGRDLDDGPGPGDARLGAGHTHTHTFLGHSFNDITTHGLRDGPKETDSTRTMVRPLLGATGEPVAFPSSPVSVCLFLLLFSFSRHDRGDL
jgi:hypothetical protein